MARLIDTSVFVQLERRGHDLASLRGRNWFETGETVGLAAITASELLVGLHRADSVERRAGRERFLERPFEALAVIPLDLRVARVHAQIWSDLKGRGQDIGAHDLQIAATALAHGYAVVTVNLRDFERVPALEVLPLQ